MLFLENIDLSSDPAASYYLKDEVVDVIFAEVAGELQSLEGPNRYSIGDPIITGSTGSRWCVSLERFTTKYEPVPPLEMGESGQYRNKPIPVLAKRIASQFSIQRSRGGDRLNGEANDWLMQYGPGDYGIVADARFQQVYKPHNK